MTQNGVACNKLRIRSVVRNFHLCVGVSIGVAVAFGVWSIRLVSALRYTRTPQAVTTLDSHVSVRVCLCVCGK